MTTERPWRVDARTAMPPAAAERAPRPSAGAAGGDGLWSLFGAWLRLRRTERLLRAQGRSIRSTDPAAVRAAYAALSPTQFADLNGPQRWLNARLLPRVLRRLPATRPWRLLDLGCGDGASSQRLLELAPRGSSLLGVELSAPLVAEARGRAYRDRAGRTARAEFVCQSLLEPLRGSDGRTLPAQSVDVAHAAGLVGHHFTERDLRHLAAELRRVLARPDGFAILDAGPALRADRLTQVLAEAGFRRVACHRVVPFAARAALVFRLREEHTLGALLSGPGARREGAR